MSKLNKYTFNFLFLFFISHQLYSQDIFNLFPINNEVSGWNRSGEMRSFANDKLWEYIDGGAENYYLYGFQRVVTNDYKNDKKQIVLDIYELSDPKNAFGLYASERDPKYNFMKLGVQGYLAGTSLNFWKGNYYFKMTTFDKSTDTKEALKQFARVIEKKLAGNFSEPAFLNLFPKSNLISNSARYFPKDILGHSFLNNGYMAEYKNGKDKFKIFLLDAGNIKSAQSCYMNYKNFITQAKGFEKGIQNVGSEAFSGKDSGRKIMVFYNSKLMGIIVGLDDESKSIKLLQETSKK